MDQKKFIKICNVVSLINIFILLFAFTITSFVKKDNSYIYGALLCSPFPFLTSWIGGKIVDYVFSLGKNNVKKWKVFLQSMLLYIIKYIIMVTPLLIGVICNTFTDQIYFNTVSIVLGTLVYPITVLIAQFAFVGKPWKKKNDIKQS